MKLLNRERIRDQKQHGQIQQSIQKDFNKLEINITIKEINSIKTNRTVDHTVYREMTNMLRYSGESCEDGTRS